LWEVRKNQIGVFYAHLYDGRIGGFSEEIQEESFELALPKIPRDLLNQAIAFFRRLTDEHDFEAYVQFIWNTDDKKYRIEVPAQKVSKGRVKYEQPDLDRKKDLLVCEVHSHNSMSSFFSPVDNADEFKRGDRFFGVIGDLHRSDHSMKLSYIIGGNKRIMIPVDDLFDNIEFPQVWLQNVIYLDHEQNEEFHRVDENVDEGDLNVDKKGGWDGESLAELPWTPEDPYNMKMVSIEDEDQLNSWLDSDTDKDSNGVLSTS
jgi:PRTRC genetic system protein A